MPLSQVNFTPKQIITALDLNKWINGLIQHGNWTEEQLKTLTTIQTDFTTRVEDVEATLEALQTGGFLDPALMGTPEGLATLDENAKLRNTQIPDLDAGTW